MIEVILLERIERLGQMGQVVKVRPGFARNFLLPQQKALRATKINLDLFEKKRAEFEAANATERNKAQALAAKMDGLSFVVIRQASDAGQLYGSVGARDVADAVKEAGETVERSQVQIDQPIKALGLFPVKVKLHPEVTIKIMVNVARSPEEATVQADKTAAAAKAAKKDIAVEDVFVPAAEAEEEKPAAKKPAAKAKAKADDAEDEKPTKGDKDSKTKKTRAKKSA